MADASYNTKVYEKQGGEQFVVASGGSIKVETGGSILPNSGTQASAITTVSTSNAGSPTMTNDQLAAALDLQATAINALIAAVRNVGITA